MTEYNAKVLAEIQSQLWAVEPSVLEAMIGAVTADMGPRVEGARGARVKDGIGFVDINGPIAARDSWIAQFFGFNSVEQISADLRALEADGDVVDIVLVMDTPGGSTVGLSDLAEQIQASSKRVTTYVSGMLASAGYWFGSASSNIVVSESALVGSIGVVATVTPWVEPGSITVVSSQSPNKNLDPTKDAGRAALQKLVDDLAAVFIGRVAANRGVSPEIVQNEYGRGSVYIAGEALERGMVDGVSSLQGLIGTLTAARGSTKAKGKEMDVKTLKAEHRDVFDAAVAMGVDGERKRVEAHLVLAEAAGDLDTAIEAIKRGDELDALYTAKYQAAGMRRAQAAARAADNPVALDGNVEPRSTKTELELVADAVVEGMSGYLKGGI